MDTSILKKFPTNILVLSNILVRLLSFCVLVLLARFAYVVTVNTHSCDSLDHCFFPNSAADRGRAYYSSVFRDLITEGVLSATSNSLCIQCLGGDEVAALREIGVSNPVRVSSKKLSSFSNHTFDFEFSGTAALDRAAQPVQFASHVSRTLKPGGFLVVHTTSSVDEYSLRSLLKLFDCFTLFRLREINGLDSLTPTTTTTSIREIILRKQNVSVNHGVKGKTAKNSCRVPRYKRELIRKAEPLIVAEPLKPWIALKQNIKNVKYLSSMVDISFKNRYIYVDVGSRSYGSSIVSWFKKQYPKQDKAFEVYAVEADSAFHDEYKTKKVLELYTEKHTFKVSWHGIFNRFQQKGVMLLPYAAWIRNETLFFEISREANKKNVGKGRGMGRIQAVQSSSNFMDVNKIEGFDFALWLKSMVTADKDYVVMKMDVEGTEFNLIPRLIETGAICLIDEMFLECHYNRWQRCCPGKRSPKYHKTYAQCLELFSSLRSRGVLVHQWW